MALRAAWVIALLICSGGCSDLSRQLLESPAVQYLGRLRGGVSAAREQMPAITRSAEIAALRVTGGGRIFATGTQECFQLELVGRAGGLSAIKAAPTAMIQLRRGDVILFGARGGLRSRELAQISRYRQAGAYVIAFASAAGSDLQFFRPDVLIDNGPEPGVFVADGKISPSDTVINVINAWAWTGEFVSACTRLRRMPEIQRTRAGGSRDFYPGSTIAPVAAGVLGTKYLDQMDLSLSLLEEEGTPALETAGAWLRDARPEGSSLQAMGAMFPYHFKDPRAPRAFGSMGLFEKTGASRPTPFVMVLGQHKPPQLAIDSAHLRRSKLLYTSVERASDDRADYILYVDPHRPAGDACVTVPGYDVPALPTSGVMQAAIYWSLVAQAAGAPIPTSSTPGE